MRALRPLLPALVVLSACDGHTMDDVLQVQHLQALGTHNSYHVMTVTHPAWQYTMDPLDVQLGDHGVRQFELDVYRVDGQLMVHHVPALDQGTTCETLAKCVQVQADWSEDNSWHHPIVTMVELKFDMPAELSERDVQLREVEQVIQGAWGDRLVRPQEVQGDASTLRQAVESTGWPTLGETRGKAMYFLLETGGWRDALTASDTTVQGRILFANGGGEDCDMCVVHSINGPHDERIAELVGRNHLVRTRSDTDGEEARAVDYTRAQAAFASGAHFISTDFPSPHPDTGFVVRVPDGEPSRCNPLNSPLGCTPTLVE
jgi:hypothetical protein